MDYLFETSDNKLARKITGVMNEHAAEGEALVAEAEKKADPYPHYYYGHYQALGAIKFSAPLDGRWAVDSQGRLIDTKTHCSEASFDKMTKAEFDERVRKAGEKERWAVSRWKFNDWWGSVEEYRSSDGGLTQEIKLHYKSGVVGAWRKPCFPDWGALEITPARAREIMDGWAKEREVRCFEGNAIKYLLRYEGNECVERINSTGTEDNSDSTVTLDKQGHGVCTEFPPAEWESRVKALQPDSYAEAKAAWGDGELQYQTIMGIWVDWSNISGASPDWTGKPERFRRRPAVQEHTYRPWTAEEAIGQKVRKQSDQTVSMHSILSAGQTTCSVLRFAREDNKGSGLHDARRRVIEYPTLLADWETIDGQKCGVLIW